jgi:hypothetical protein
MSRFSEGITFDGAAILCDGQPVPIEDVVAGLNERDELEAERDRLRAQVEALKQLILAVNFSEWLTHDDVNGMSWAAARDAALQEGSDE